MRWHIIGSKLSLPPVRIALAVLASFAAFVVILSLTRPAMIMDMLRTIIAMR